jgi:hypothetical protein
MGLLGPSGSAGLSYFGLVAVVVFVKIDDPVDVNAVCSPTVSVLLPHPQTSMIASGC